MKTQEFSNFDVIFESGRCDLPRINFRTDEIGLKVIFVVFFDEFLLLKFLIFSRRNSTGELRRKFPKNCRRLQYKFNVRIFGRNVCVEIFEILPKLKNVDDVSKCRTRRLI